LVLAVLNSPAEDRKSGFSDRCALPRPSYMTVGVPAFAQQQSRCSASPRPLRLVHHGRVVATDEYACLSVWGLAVKGAVGRWW